MTEHGGHPVASVHRKDGGVTGLMLVKSINRYLTRPVR
jgi:hypothetical protein